MSIFKDELSKFKIDVATFIKKIILTSREFSLIAYRKLLRIIFYTVTVLIAMSVVLIMLYFTLDYFGAV